LFGAACALVTALLLFVPALGGDLRTTVSGESGTDATEADGLSVTEVTDEGGCSGAMVDLIPYNLTPNTTDINNPDRRGAFVTALKDFEVCAIGMEIDLVTGRTLTARVYAADGVIRGALLATGSMTAFVDGKVMHYVPINVSLSACQEYEIEVDYPGNDYWDWWSEADIGMPFDVGGVIRVRDAARQGSPSTTALPYLSVIGTESDCDQQVTIGPGGLALTFPDDNQERGFFARLDRTIGLCSLSWYANLVPPQTLTARVYNAVGTARADLIAEGTIVVTASGTRWHDIPINVTLLEGRDYDLAIAFGTTNSWRYWDDRTLFPYAVSPFVNIDAEYFGNPNNWALPYFRVGFTDGVGGAPINLAKLNDVYPPPNVTSQDSFDYGAYVTSLTDQEMYSVGWKADVPPGEIIGARIYEATGTVRGALMTQGYIQSSGDGMRWHDVPVAAALVSGADYDIEIEIMQVNQWRAWSDGSGLPYDSYGLMRVRDGEQGGSAANGWLIEMRYNGCNETATGIEDRRPQKAPLYLAAPSPNPGGAMTRIDFNTEQAGTVRLEVFDVRGRRVATILNGDFRTDGPHSTEIDTRRLPTGVYFVKLTSSAASVSRKFVVVR